METAIKCVWKTEEELIQEFYQLKDELDAAYQQDLQIIVEEDEKELIIGFSTRKEGYTYEMTTNYTIHQGQDSQMYEKVKPYWYASRSGRVIANSDIESADEAMRVVMASMEILSEIDFDVEDEKSTLERDNRSPLRIRYTYRHPEDNSEVSKVFPIEGVECGDAKLLRKDLEDRGYTLVDTSVENDRLFKQALFEYRDHIRERQAKANQSKFEQTINQWFDSGKSMAHRIDADELDEIFQEFL